MRHSIIEKCGSALVIVLLALVAILLCVSFRGVVWRMDCTEEKSHTLSSATRKALSSLEKKVTIHYYYSKDLAQMPVGYKNYARRVEELLREYEIASKGKLRSSSAIRSPTRMRRMRRHWTASWGSQARCSAWTSRFIWDWLCCAEARNPPCRS